MSRKSQIIILNEHDANILHHIVQNQPDSVLAKRASVILECAKGHTNKDIAAKYSMTENDVGKWRKRFLAEGINGLQNKHGGGAQASMNEDELDRRIDELLADTEHEWTIKGLAEAAGATYYSVSKSLQRKNMPTLQRQSEWLISTEDELVSKRADVIGLYLSYQEQAIVLCCSPKTLVKSNGILITRNRSFAEDLQTVQDGTISLASTIMTAYWHTNDTTERVQMSISDFLDSVLKSNPQENGCEYHAFICSQDTPKRIYRGEQLDRLHISVARNVEQWLGAVQVLVEGMGDINLLNATRTLNDAIQKYMQKSIATTIPLTWMKKVVFPETQVAEIVTDTEGQSSLQKTKLSLQDTLAKVLRESMSDQVFDKDTIRYGFITYAMDQDEITIGIPSEDQGNAGVLSSDTFEFNTKDGFTDGLTAFESNMIETRNQAGIQGAQLVLDLVKKNIMRSASANQ